MATLIAVKKEVYEEAGNVCVFGYFDGTPTEAELKEAGGGEDGFTEPFLANDEFSQKLVLQRWYLSQSV